MNTAEKVETVVLTYLETNATTGTLGTLAEFEPGKYKVAADGKTFFVHTTPTGWSVTLDHFEGLDENLYYAAHAALHPLG